MLQDSHPDAGAATTGAGRVVVIDEGRELGRLVLERLGSTAGVERAELVGLDGPALAGALQGADVVAHLAVATGPSSGPDPAAPGVDATRTRRLLDAMGAAGVRHLVLASSAVVYGAWPGNPVPLTEEAPLRPNPGFEFGAERAELERLCTEWAAAGEGRSVAVLRPVPILGDDDDRLWPALRAVSAIRPPDPDTPTQLIHLDDLARAVALACGQRLDGAYNVAPDGWVAASEVRALAGAGPRFALPEGVARTVASWTWRWRLRRTPPGLLPYVLHPWVVANDRLRGAGWEPASSSEEAIVETHEGSPWSRLSPKRRQELALGAAALVLAGTAAGAGLVVRRLLRRRRQASVG